MGLLKDFKKYGATDIFSAIMSEDKQNISNSKGIYRLERIEEFHSMKENYGSGGWIEGTEWVERRFVLYLVFNEDKFLGWIHPYNVHHMNPNRYSVVVSLDEELVRNSVKYLGEKHYKR